VCCRFDDLKNRVFQPALEHIKVILKLVNPARSAGKCLNFLIIIVHKNVFFFMCSCAGQQIFRVPLCT